MLIATMYDTMDVPTESAWPPTRSAAACGFVYDCAADWRNEPADAVWSITALETSEIPETMPDLDTDDEGRLSVPASHFYRTLK